MRVSGTKGAKATTSAGRSRPWSSPPGHASTFGGMRSTVLPFWLKRAPALTMPATASTMSSCVNNTRARCTLPSAPVATCTTRSGTAPNASTSTQATPGTAWITLIASLSSAARPSARLSKPKASSSVARTVLATPAGAFACVGLHT